MLVAMRASRVVGFGCRNCAMIEDLRLAVEAIVRAFAALLVRLADTPSRLGKLRPLTDYFPGTPDPARGHALAALTGGLTG